MAIEAPAGRQTPAPQSGPSLADQLKAGREQIAEAGSEAADILRELQSLARKEAELARTEMAEQIAAARQAAMFGAAAGLLALLALAFAAVTLMFALDTFLPTWVAALITTGVLVLLAGICAALLMERMKQVTVTPKKTINSISEDVRWARRQMTFSAK